MASRTRPTVEAHDVAGGDTVPFTRSDALTLLAVFGTGGVITVLGVVSLVRYVSQFVRWAV